MCCAILELDIVHVRRLHTFFHSLLSNAAYLSPPPHGQVRIEQLFNIIIEYPESEPALVDLKQCLEKINLRTELVTSLKTALETRLLHPGMQLYCCKLCKCTDTTLSSWQL